MNISISVVILIGMISFLACLLIIKIAELYAGTITTFTDVIAAFIAVVAWGFYIMAATGKLTEIALTISWLP